MKRSRSLLEGCQAVTVCGPWHSREGPAIETLDRVRAWIERRLPVLVLAVGALGVVTAAAARRLAELGAINLVLFLLVASAALAIDPTAGRPSRQVWIRVAAALVAGVTVLPLLAWVCAGLVSDPALRGGVLSAGVAPAEVASVAIVAVSGGDAGVAAVILVGSTVASVLAAGPILQAAGGGSVANPWSIGAGLAVVVGAPLAAGLALGRRSRGAPAVPAVAGLSGLLLVLALVWLVGGQVRLDRDYLVAAVALTGFLAGSTAVGAAIGWRTTGREALALVLTTGMRDFAIAAGIAATAFGPASAGPLGIYGLLVLLLGGVATARASRSGGTAGATRRRPRRSP